MATIINGKEVSAAVRAQVAQETAALKQRGIVRDVQLKLAQTEEERAASVLNFTDTIYLQTEEAKA